MRLLKLFLTIALSLALFVAGLFCIDRSLTSYRLSQSVRLHSIPGGELFAFMNYFERLRDDKRKIVLDGACLSACTMVLGMIEPENLCATKHAYFGFHSAWSYNEKLEQIFSKDGTLLVWRTYPENVKKVLRDKYKWDGAGKTANHPDLIIVNPSEFSLEVCE